jgi:DNA-binding beta-propeller fold protein YncE
MAWALGYDSANGLVYCSHGFDSAVTFIDSRTDSVVGSLNAGMWATTFATVPAHSRVYVGGEGNSSIAVIRTDPLGVEEAALPRTKKVVRPTVVSRSTPLVVHQPSVLLDAAGRKVCDLDTGSHELGCCRAGVYFVRSEPSAVSRQPSAVTKVVIAR